ncbi:MAG: choice-of-anchor Q domain-containing protein, partial [Planctomycetota bacterium]
MSARRRRRSPRLEPLENRRLLATLVVNSTLDNFDPTSPATDGMVTLREAIMAANADAQVGDAPAGSGADTITFDPAVFNTPQGIDLNDTELTIGSSVTIVGPGTELLNIDGNRNVRVLNVDDSLPTQSVVSISDLTIRRGRVLGQDGGGVLNRENLTLQRVSVKDNEIGNFLGRGVGIANLGGALNIHDSEIIRNEDGGEGTEGGGIFSTGPLTITGSVIAGNSIGGNANGRGGGIFSSGGAVIRHSTIAGNSADAAFSSEVGGKGGGIFAINGLVLDHVVVADNTAVGDPNRVSTPDIDGPVTSFYSLIEDTTGATITDNGGTITGIDPRLNGSGTPASTSILINAGDPAAVAGQGNVPLKDIDGNDRIQNSRIDIGAIELEVPPGVLSITRHTPTSESTNADSLVFKVVFDEPVTGVDIADFQVVGTTATVTDVTAVDASEYRVTISGGDLAELNGVVDLNLNSSQNITNTDGESLRSLDPIIEETYTVDNLAPNVSLLSPSNPFLNVLNWPGKIDVSVADASALTSVGITIQRLGGGGRFWDGTAFSLTQPVYFTATQVPGTNTWTWPFALENLVLQNYRFFAQATDSVGQTFAGQVGGIFNFSNTFIVDTAIDEFDGNYSAGDLSLREALAVASQVTTGPSTIVISGNLRGQTLSLTLGELAISGDITIDGEIGDDAGPDFTIHAGHGSDGNPGTFDGSRIFVVDDGDASRTSNVTIEGLTLIGGDLANPNFGGAILNSENLTVKNSVLRDNAVQGNGGAIFNRESAGLNVIDSSFVANQAQNSGGAIYVSSSGFADVQNSTLAQNSSRLGGAVVNLGTFQTSNSTYSANTAFESGGAISTLGQLTVRHSTFWENTAPVGSAVGSLNNAGNYFFTHSIVGGAVVGTTITGDHNLFAQDVAITGSNNLQSTDPRLGALQDNGGITDTHAPASDSPAINAGDSSFAGGQNGVPLNDQRGRNYERVVQTIDIGAHETQLTPALLSFTRETPADQQTQADSLVFKAVFNKEVLGVDASDFEVTGTTAAITNVSRLNGLEYLLTVSGGDLADLNAVVGLNLSSNQNIVDLIGVGLVSVEPGIDELYTVDNAAPVTTLVSPIDRFLNPANYLGSIEITADDASQVASVGIGIRNQGAARFWDGNAFASRDEMYFSATQIPGTNRWTWDFDVSNFVPQNYQIWVEATDSLGQRSVGTRSGNLIYSEVITVDNLLDESDGDFSNGDLSLREAIERASLLNNGYTITFANGLQNQTINLTLGELTIAGDLTIDGDLNNDGRPEITIDAGNGPDGEFGSGDGTRIFNISDGDSSSSNRNVVLAGLTLTGGDSDGEGGAIRNAEDLTIRDSTISGNSAQTLGGAIFSLNFSGATGQLKVINSSLVNNRAGVAGGAVRASLVVSFELTDSLIAFNSAPEGGGIYSNADLTILNSTLSTNSATGNGGGIYNIGEVNISHSTISDNTATSGQAIYELDGTDVSYTVSQSIIGGTVFNAALTGDHNLFGQTVTITGTNNQQNTDPKLGPLQDNGGLTHTHALLPGSPAINAGDPNAVAGVGGVPQFDQRGTGFPRVENSRIDIGAFESEQPPTVLSFTRQTPSNESTNADSLVFKATFDEEVTGVDAADFETSGTTATATDVTRLNGSEYLVTVSGGDLTDLNSVVGLNLSANQEITDLGGASLTNAEPVIDETYTLDNLAPVTALVSPADILINPANYFGSIEVTADDASQVASVGIGIRNLGAARFWDGSAFVAAQETYFAATQIPGTNRWTWDFDVANFVPQNYQIWVEATDVFGQRSSGLRSGNFIYSDVITVDSLLDESDGDFSNGDLSLREAIERASVLNNGYTITFANSLQNQTIDLTGGVITIGGDLTIDGDLNNDGRPDITIDAGNGTDGVFGTGDGTRIFHIFDGSISGSNANVVLAGLTLTGGDSIGDSGAIFNSENLTIRDSVISGNSAQTDGGAILSLNFSGAAGQLKVINSSLTNNSAGARGGAVRADSSVSFELTNSLIAFNTAEEGGAIYSNADLTILNSTLSTNSATDNGGGIYNIGSVNISHSTISDNTATSGQAIYEPDGIDVSYTVSHSIIGGTVVNAALTGNHNLFGQTVTITGTNNQQNTDPKLGPLQDNGGATHTHALLPDSPAIDGGDPNAVAGVGGVPQFDQRGPGFSRVRNLRADVGAFESDASPAILSFTRQTPSSEITNADQLVFRAIFDEDVVGVDTADFRVSFGTTAIVSNVASVDARTYEITVSGGDLADYDGSVGVNLAGKNNIVDGSGTPLIEGEPAIDQTFQLDNTRPTLLSFTRQTPASQFTTADALTFRVTFDEDVTGVDVADFDVAGTSTALVTAVSSIDARTYEVTLSDGDLASFDGLVGLNLGSAASIADSAGNLPQTVEPATDETYEVYNAPSIQVSTLSDLVDGDFSAGQLGIRESLLFAEALPSLTTINFASSLAGGTIALTQGALSVGGNLTIQGPGADQLTISGEDASQVFLFAAGTYNITGLDIANGRSTFYGGAINTAPGHNLTIRDSVIRNSFASFAGGGLRSNEGTLTLIDSAVVNNSAGTQSGGIDFFNAANSQVINSTISGNSATSSRGGGFVNTASPNRTSLVTLTNVTMADNTAPAAGSFATAIGSGAIESKTRYRNSIFTTTSESNIVVGGLTARNESLGYNISSDGTGNLAATGDQPNTNPLLGPLQDNGGPTPTHALLSGSPAINSGSSALALDQTGQQLQFDQRGDGFARVNDGSVDIGAFETGTPSLLSFERFNPTSEFTTGDTLIFRATFDEDVTGVDVADFTVVGGTTAAVSIVNNVDARTYDLFVFGGDLANFNGTVGLNLAGDANIIDLNGNLVTIIEPATDETYTVDNIAPQVESIAYEDGSAQRSIIRSITVNFDSDVIIDSGAFVLTTKSGTNIPLNAPAISLVDGKTQALLTFAAGANVDASGSLIDGNYRLNVLSDKIRDRAGNAFDGDRDGTAGGDVVDSFFRLYGDSDGDRDVD